MSNFEIITQDSNSAARLGRVKTAAGVIDTPAFMPVGTRASVKGLTPEQLIRTGSQILLANTYHMMLRPGVETVQALGGLHKIMAWPGPILTDSGGYQLFSLSTLNRIGDEGVEFASHIDGKKIFLDARTVTEIQNKLGADIIMCFDDCAPLPSPKERLQKAVQRTVTWAHQCRQAHKNPDQMLFAVVQGGIDLNLRSLCAEQLVKMDFDGYAVGGLSVGESHEEMVKTAQNTAEMLPHDKPRYLMGVGTPADIIAAVNAGIDMFDCVLPTRNGRNAFAFTKNQPIRLRNSNHIDDSGPIDDNCNCYCCENFSRGALRHFFNVGEMLGPILVSIHNITFYQRLMSEIRDRIKKRTFAEWAQAAQLTAN